MSLFGWFDILEMVYEIYKHRKNPEAIPRVVALAGSYVLLTLALVGAVTRDPPLQYISIAVAIVLAVALFARFIIKNI